MALSRSRITLIAALASTFAVLCAVAAFVVLRGSDNKPSKTGTAASASGPNSSGGSTTSNTPSTQTRSSTISDEGEERDITFVQHGGIPEKLDVFFPKLDGTPLPALITVHGGVWKSDDASVTEPLATSLRDTMHVPVFNIHFRTQTPGYPAEVDDVEAAVTWIRANGGRWNVDASRIALLGVSSGANLVLEEGLRGQGPNDSGTRVAAIVSYSAPTDLAAFFNDPKGGPEPKDYLGCSPNKCPDLYAAASPVTHVDPTDPPVFLLNSTAEQIPASQEIEMARKLVDAGVDTQVLLVDGTKHGHELAAISDIQAQVIPFLLRTLQLPGAPPKPPPPDLDALQAKAAN
jgi:acetyl esterase